MNDPVQKAYALQGLRGSDVHSQIVFILRIEIENNEK